MNKQLENDLINHRSEVYLLFRKFVEHDLDMLLRSDVTDTLREFTATVAGEKLRGTKVEELFMSAQEAIIRAPYLCLVARPRIGVWHYYQFHLESVEGRMIPVTEFLKFKEGINGNPQGDGWDLEIDLTPFDRGFPRLKDTRSIGRGVEFLNRHLSDRLFKDSRRGRQNLYKFLRLHHHDGLQLMLNNLIDNEDELLTNLERADRLLGGVEPETPWEQMSQRLRELGFEPGWGRTAKRIRATMTMLSDILEAPDPTGLEKFLAIVPMVNRIVILSPHGFFGQANVLGKPDTGGQVVYILDQVRALEEEMRNSIHEAGLDIHPQIIVVTRLIPECGDTTCNQRIEPITGTRHSTILRVPFRDAKGEVVPHWISRFKIWPYLERFAEDAEKEVLLEMGRQPDFIVGNYSDGNLVATLMARKLGITQCTIAHALEKTKYLHSDLYWQSHEEDHRFTCQFTADLMAMNNADFIIASTYQEIAGTDSSVGQYESYGSFTMPGFCRVVKGVDVFDPKFNIVSPGADSRIFFPYTEKERRSAGITQEVESMIFDPDREDARGHYINPDKPIVFAMSRIDYVKNTTGFLEWYGQNERLRNETNLLIVGGMLDPENSNDTEEKEMLQRMHDLFDAYELEGQARWVRMQSDKNIVSEFYRIVADKQGAFVQPALFEAFGLTVVEAMSCGLPVFATCYGGPLEIIEDGKSGFHINPNHGDKASDLMADFFGRCREKPSYWDEISAGAMKRVAEKYTWQLYANRMLTLSRVYGFWKFISNIEREETHRYLDLFYGLVYRERAKQIQS